MPRQARKLSSTGIYHVMLRGVPALVPGLRETVPMSQQVVSLKPSPATLRLQGEFFAAFSRLFHSFGKHTPFLSGLL